MDLNDVFVESIITATTKVFSTMLHVDVKAEEHFIKSEKNVSTDIISSIHFSGRGGMGKIALFMPGATACHLASAMLGMEVDAVDVDVKDCMGEMVNMIAGNAKNKFENFIGKVNLLVPWVISGTHLSITSPYGTEVSLSIDSQAQFSWVMTKFSYPKGTFLVGIQFNKITQDRTDESFLEKRVKELEDENQMLKLKLQLQDLQVVTY